MVTRLIVVIILLYIQISNHYLIWILYHLELIHRIHIITDVIRQLYLNWKKESLSFAHNTCLWELSTSHMKWFDIILLFVSLQNCLYLFDTSGLFLISMGKIIINRNISCNDDIWYEQSLCIPIKPSWASLVAQR